MKSEPRAPLLKPLTVQEMAIGRRDVAADPMYRTLRQRALDGEGAGCEWPPGSLGNMPVGTWNRRTFRKRPGRNPRKPA
jgi:hypothetical protein